MRKQIAAILIFAASASSCLRSEMEGPVHEGLSLIATLAQEQPDAKSYFGPAGEQLYWSAYDDLGVFDYTKDLASEVSEKIHGEKFILKTRDGSNATFAENGNGQWTGTGEDQYYFYGYYPEKGKSIKEESGGIVKGMEVPSIQSMHFGNYHICYTPQPAMISAGQIENGTPVHLAFSPATSLISICPVLDESSPLESIKLSEITVTFENAAVAGKCNLNLADGSLSILSGALNTITLDLKDQHIVMRKERSARVDAVVLPVADYSGDVRFTFKAADQSITLSEVTKRVTGKSLKKGSRYTMLVSGIEASVLPTDKSANCYLVDANRCTSVMIPLYQGIAGWKAVDSYNSKIGRSTAYEEKYRNAIYNDVTAEMVWTDNPSLKVSGEKISISSGRYLQLSFTDAANGSNAVVAMKGTDGKVLWSWHIWFTDYNPDIIIDRSKGKVANGLVHKYQGTLWDGGIYSDKYMMDRNLGSRLVGFSSAVYPDQTNLPDYYGLYYQFGRKDPFPTEGIGGKLSSEASPVDIEKGILNPGTFYTDATGGDWISNAGVCTDPWAGSSDTVLEKSAFDPCPVGWRVPVCYLSDDNGSVRLNTWSDFSATAFKARTGYFLYKGTDYDGNGLNNTIYPLSGRLSRGNGNPYVQASEGCYWSSSPQASYASNAPGNARCFLFKSGTDGGSTNGDATARSNALAIRCVQDGSYPPASPHWELNSEKSDDFYTYDSSKWQTSAWFTDSYCSYSGNNVSISDGMLKIAMTKEPSGGKAYTGGVAKSKFTVGAGTAVEFRARVAPHKAHIRSALWLSDTPVAEKNPNMEIDLMETWASDTWPDWKFSSGILYWWIGSDKPSWYLESNNGMMPIGLLYYRQDHSAGRTEKWLSEDFHTFRLERLSSSVRFYIDGNLYWERFCDSETYASGQTAPSVDDAASNNMMSADIFSRVLLQERNLIMSVHSSGSAPIDAYLPCEMLIDYVHVYDYVQ